MRDLKSICETEIGSELNIESVCDVLILADMHSANNLKDTAIEFIKDNSYEVIKTNGWKRLQSNTNLSTVGFDDFDK